MGIDVADFQLPLSGSRRHANSLALLRFCCLSTPSLGITAVIKIETNRPALIAFNSLSRDHKPTSATRSRVEAKFTNFQLPLSGSLDDRDLAELGFKAENFQLPLSGSHGAGFAYLASKIPLTFQLPLSGSQSVRQENKVLAIFGFQLPLSGSLYSLLGAVTYTLVRSFNSLSRDHSVLEVM